MEQQETMMFRDKQRDREEQKNTEETNRNPKENTEIREKEQTKEIFMNNEGKLMKINKPEDMRKLEVQKGRYEGKDTGPFVPKEVKMISHGTAIGTFENANEANGCQEKLEKEKEIQTSIDSRRITCKGVIVDWTDSIPELWEAIEDQNRDKIEESIKLWNDRVRLKVRPYVQQVKQCFDCFRYGHIKAVCKSEQRCIICSGKMHERCSNKIRCRNCGGEYKSTSK
ncbi:hypothetical protein PV327_006170 [Microctonus hyperodae]|uniref:Uncharacterized protein n=1 Tax=Microctonus hyperodae TaxID=165561 RepID=A0AA39F3Q5_MICHY|nr:hypothetical protein PV327_006170 [Microctonus hyperodae]